MNHINHRNDCRLCESTQLDLVLPILPSAIGDAFVSKEQILEKQNIYPLDTYLCLDCGHLQNIDIVHPEILFRNYTYRTSSSLGLIKHFQQYAINIINFLNMNPQSFIVEIGSNDGALLKAFKENNMKVMGVDPAINIAKLASDNGIFTIPDFFTLSIAEKIKIEYGKANLICANNVFAHIDNLKDLVKGISTLLTSDGVFVFEVSYVVDMINNLVFDTIYHEHVSHHALIPLERFLNHFDLTLFHVEKINTKGGSIRGFVQKIDGKRPKTMQLKTMLLNEIKNELFDPKTYHHLFQRIEDTKKKIQKYIKLMIDTNKKIAAYGASTTTTTLMYHFELGDKISFIIDDNPSKQHLFSPGFHLPVLPSTELDKNYPDVIIILAWLYADIIIEKNYSYLNRGGKFLIPLPAVKIIDKNSTTMIE